MRLYIQHGRRHGPGGSDPIPDIDPGGGGTRIVYGQIDATGSSGDSGSGDWTVSDGYTDDSGIWTITLDTPMTGAGGDGTVPTVVASENNNGFEPLGNFIVVYAVTTTTIEIHTYAGDTRALTSGIAFNFIAAGQA